MRKRLAVLVWTLLAAALAYGEAEYYKVRVTRIEDNLYREDDTHIFIRTAYCYEYAYYEDAILKFEPYGLDNKLIFEDGSVCEVRKVFK